MSGIDILLVAGLFVYGAVLGSFAGAQVWRMRAKQLHEDKQAGEPYDKAELQRLTPLHGVQHVREDRSRCLGCGHALGWYDLLPLVSWLSTGGKCRYCKQPIGTMEPLLEIGTATLFVVSYVAWPVELTSVAAIAQFVVWLAACVVMVVLFAYDTRWYLLPNHYTFALAILGSGYCLLGFIIGGRVGFEQIISLGGAMVILSGIYLALHFYSRGRWIGLGDVKLGVGLALLAGEWQLAFLGLFVANLLGVLFVIPLLATGHINRKAHIPFGPFLILGTVAAVLYGQMIVDSYMSSLTALYVI